MLKKLKKHLKIHFMFFKSVVISERKQKVLKNEISTLTFYVYSLKKYKF